MNGINLLFIQFKTCLKDFTSLLFIIIAVITSLVIGLWNLKQEEKISLAIANDDNGKYSEEIIKILEKQNLSFEQLTFEQGKKMIKYNKLEALFYIEEDFTEKLEKGEFENIIKLYKSPSSQQTASITEPIINATMSIWMEEQAVIRSKDYLEKNKLELNDETEKEIRRKFDIIWENGAKILIGEVQLDSKEEKIMDTNLQYVYTCIYWYLTLCLFYLIISSSWILDINKNVLRMRSNQKGKNPWKLLLISSIPTLFICFIGYFVVSIASCAATNISLTTVFEILPIVIVYFINLLGMTLILARLLGTQLLLMFIAPVITFLNATLSGLIIKLPEWLNVVKLISYVLPGRWVVSYIEVSKGSLMPAILCASLWTILGIVISIKYNHYGGNERRTQL